MYRLTKTAVREFLNKARKTISVSGSSMSEGKTVPSEIPITWDRGRRLTPRAGVKCKDRVNE